MTRRQFIWVGVAVLFLFAGVGLWTMFGVHSVSFTEKEIQNRINTQLHKEFPVKKRVAHILVKTVSMQGATIRIDNGRIIALIDIEGTMRAGKKFSLTVYAVGVPTYAHGDFYFSPEDIEVQKFAYEGKTPTEFFSNFARRYVSNQKVRQFIEDKAPGVEEWITVTAQNAAMHALERRPVYRLKDDMKGFLIRASLESVKIEQDRIVLTMTLLRLTLTVLGGLIALIAAIVIMYALMTNPLMGLAADFLS